MPQAWDRFPPAHVSGKVRKTLVPPLKTKAWDRFPQAAVSGRVRLKPVPPRKPLYMIMGCAVVWEMEWILELEWGKLYLATASAFSPPEKNAEICIFPSVIPNGAYACSRQNPKIGARRAKLKMKTLLFSEAIVWSSRSPQGAEVQHQHMVAKYSLRCKMPETSCKPMSCFQQSVIRVGQ